VVGGLTSGSDLMAGIGFGLAGFMVVSMIALGIRDASAASAERRRIWKNGTPAHARVISVVEVGGEDTPEVDLDLEVGTPPTRVKVRSLISRVAIPRIQPGCEIQVRVDPADGRRVVIDPGLTPYRMD
jgi:hypothetical protein